MFVCVGVDYLLSIVGVYLCNAVDPGNRTTVEAPIPKSPPKTKTGPLALF